MKTLLAIMIVGVTMLSTVNACSFGWELYVSDLEIEVQMLTEQQVQHAPYTEIYRSYERLIRQKIYKLEGAHMDRANVVNKYGDGIMCKMRMSNVLGY